MSGDLISRDALKKDFEERYKACDKWIEKAKDEEIKIRADATKSFICEVIMTIDNAPTALHDNYSMGYQDGVRKVLSERPQGECKTCRHRDPEDKKCDCGGQERIGCLFPVRNDYYCKYYEKGGEK